MANYLAIYDLSGIQRFIFATNKMAEIIGASKVVHDALYENLPNVLGVEMESWKSGDIAFSSAEERKIVYIGGGNALVLYANEELYKKYTRMLQKSVFEISGGSLNLFSACIELDETKNLSDNQKVLMSRLDEKKKQGSSASLAPAFPITSVDNNNYEPNILVEDGKYSTASSYAKLSKKDFGFDEYAPSDCYFTDELRESDREDGKNYQAVIHIDGNTMGIKIREYVNGLTGSIWNQLTNMRDLSVQISSLYNGTLKESLQDLYAGKHGRIKFRPIVADGDDITVLMEAEKAFDFVKAFIQKLQNKSVTAFGNGFKPTAAAGIAFVGFKFPFSTAYELAEACCKNAKAKTIERVGGQQAFLSAPVSSMDYQMCYTNISDSLSDFRNDCYTLKDAGVKYTLIRRPYIFDNGKYSYDAFEEMSKYWENRRTARSKLKGLRNAYGISVHEAKRYFEFINSHVKSVEENTEAQRLRTQIFNDDNESIIFDYLDIMDII